MIRTGSGEITPKVEDVESSNIGAIWRGRTDGRMIGWTGADGEGKLKGKQETANQNRKQKSAPKEK